MIMMMLMMIVRYCYKISAPCYTGNQERAHDLCPRLFIGPRPKSRQPRAGVGFLGLKSRYISWEWAAIPSAPARGSGERCDLSQRGSWRSPASKRFSTIL